MHWLIFPAHWLRQHIPEMAFSLTAMFFVVTGPFINTGLKAVTQKFHWLLRYVAFVLLSTIGYGFLGNFALRQTRGALSIMSDGVLIAAILGLHLVLAWMLKNDRKI